MKLLLENWREYVNEEPVHLDFEKQLLEEGILDYIKDKAAAAAKIKEKTYDTALRQFISISQTISDKGAPIKQIIKKYIPTSAQYAVLGAIVLAIAATGKAQLANKVATGNVSLADILGAGLGAMSEEKKNETPT